MTGFRAAVVSGQQRALVVRRGEVVVLLRPSGQDATDRALIAVVEEVAAADDGDRGRLLGRRLLELSVGLDRDDLPGFGAAAVTDGGIAVIVQGEFVVSWSSSRGVEQLTSTAGVSGWVDRVIPGPVNELFICYPDDLRERPDPWTDLRDGVMPADAVLLDGWGREAAGGYDHAREKAERLAPLRAVPAPDGPVTAKLGRPSTPEAPSPTGEAAPAAPAGRAPPNAVIFDLRAHVGERDPLPTSPDDELGVQPAGDGEVLVDGLLCPRGHFNHPEIAYCNICGIGFNQISHVLVRRQRPPLGVLVLDDGSTFALDADYVVGREPGNDPDVRSGRLRPLRLLDTTQAVSRVHAQIVARGWDAVVVDRDSSNGTYVAVPGSSGWQRLPRDQELVLPSGSRLMLGSRSMAFQSHHLPA